MFGVSGGLLSIDYRNSGQPIVNGEGIIITSIAKIENPEWTTVNINSTLIKSKNIGSFETNTITSNNPSQLNFIVSRTSNHAADVGGPPYATPYTSFTSTGQNTIGNAGGNHVHTISGFDLDVTSHLPKNVKVALYRRSTNYSSTFNLPIGTIVFAENIQNNPSVVPTSLYDNLYLSSTNIDNNIGDKDYSTNIIEYNFITSSSGNHNHGPATGVHGQSGYNPNFGSENTTAINNPPVNNNLNHSHSGKMTFTQTKKYKKLRTYVVDSDKAFISNGMIFAFNTENVSDGWYCCNGQIIKGYTTPNLVDRYIMCGNSSLSSHNLNPTENNNAIDENYIIFENLNNSTDENKWSHSHGTTSGFQTVTALQERRYHGFSENGIPHSHNITLTESIFEPNHYNLIYYIYLP
jgi:microcystin-dependent protein